MVNHPHVPDDANPTADEARRLSGWKEIARYVGRGTRTVQRWEKEHGLPIRRLAGKGGRSESVFAFAADVDDWLASTAATRARAAAGANDGGDDPTETEPSEGRTVGVTETDLVPPPPSAPRLSGWRRTAVSILGAVTLLAVLWHVRGLFLPTPAPVAVPASVRIEGRMVVALDAAGTEIWRRELPFVIQLPPADRVEDGSVPAAVGIVDVDGDEVPEVLILGRPRGPDRRTDVPGLFCLNADGSPRWVHRVEREISFGGERFGLPFLPHRYFVTAAPEREGTPALWAVSIHAQMYPSVLQRLDPRTGRPAGEYWSNGYIDAVVMDRMDGRNVLLVGACHNESKGASLAVLDAIAFSGSAPAASVNYRCTDCPPGEPLRFVVFPKPERFAALDASSSVVRLEVGADDIVVGLKHALGQTPAPLAIAFYRLDRDLVPRWASPGDGYMTVWRALTRSGVVPGNAQDTVDPVREFFPLQRWNGAAFVPLPLSR